MILKSVHHIKIISSPQLVARGHPLAPPGWRGDPDPRSWQSQRTCWRWTSWGVPPCQAWPQAWWTACPHSSWVQCQMEDRHNCKENVLLNQEMYPALIFINSRMPLQLVLRAESLRIKLLGLWVESEVNDDDVTCSNHNMSMPHTSRLRVFRWWPHRPLDLSWGGCLFPGWCSRRGWSLRAGGSRRQGGGGGSRWTPEVRYVFYNLPDIKILPTQWSNSVPKYLCWIFRGSQTLNETYLFDDFYQLKFFFLLHFQLSMH